MPAKPIELNGCDDNFFESCLFGEPVSSLSRATVPPPTTINLASTTAQMTLSIPYAALGSANNSLNLRIGNLPALPNSFTYVLWATNAASITTGLEAFRNASHTKLC